MVNKELLKKNLEYISKVKPSFVKKLIEKLPEIEKNIHIVQDVETFHIFYKGNLIRNIKERAEVKVENLENYIGGIDVGHIPNINPEDIELIRKHYNDKDSIIRHTQVLWILGTLPFLHIEKILQKKVFENLKEIVIYEPNYEFFFLFLTLIDLKKITDKYKIRIVFLPESDFENYVQSTFIAYPFVSYFVSYEDDNILDKKSKLTEILKRSLITIPYKHAFYRIKFFKNNIKLKDNKYLLQFQNVEQIRNIAKNTPILIVGSGPSLDSSIKYLKEIQDRTIIVSLTSSIGKLLENSIIPDYLAIVDTQKDMFRFIKNIDKSTLKNIYCLSHIGVETQFIKAFKENLVFTFGAFLTTLNVEPLVKAEIEGGPTVLNPTFNLFAELGFNKFILFGVDLGTKYKDKLHYENFVDYKLEVYKVKNLSIETDGNFGGKVYQTNDFYISKYILENSIKKYKNLDKDFTVYNASDGAKIVGAQPILPKEIKQVLDLKINKTYIQGLINVNFAKLKGLEIDPKIISRVKETQRNLNNLITYQKQVMKKDVNIFVKNLESLITNVLFKEQSLFNVFFANEAYQRILTNYTVLKLKISSNNNGNIKMLLPYMKKVVSDLEKINILVKEFLSS